MPTAPPDLVPLLAADHEFADAIPEAELADARQALQTAVHEIPAGPFDPPDAPFALVVARGTLFKEVRCRDRTLAELLVPGDLVLSWTPSEDGLAAERRFVALEPAQLLVLDRGFIYGAARWPGLMRELTRRLSEQEHRIAVHGAICQLPRVEERIEAVLEHLAFRIGRVGPGGTRIPLPLTHAALGELIGAQRSTVTLAAGRLAAAGRVRRGEDGSWLLPSGAS